VRAGTSDPRDEAYGAFSPDVSWSLLGGFAPEEEDDFRRHYTLRSLPFIRIFFSLGALVFLLFTFWDLTVAPEVAAQTFGARFAFLVLAMAAVTYTFHGSFLRFAQPVLMATVLAGALSIFFILGLMPKAFLWAGSTLLLLAIAACGFARLLFVPAVVTGISVIVLANAYLARSGYEPLFILHGNLYMGSALVVALVFSGLLERMERRMYVAEQQLRREKHESDRVLHSVLPAGIAERLRDGSTNIAEHVGEATVMFGDLVGFTTFANRVSPVHLVEILADVFSLLDDLADRHGVDKVKTIGDNYMVVAGVRPGSASSAHAVAEFALDSMEALSRYSREQGHDLAMRIGIATGSLVAGVIGTKVPIFDLWGQTVNLASRLESEGTANVIQVSEKTYWRLHNEYVFEDQGLRELKGGMVEHTYSLLGRRGMVSPEERRRRLSVVDGDQGTRREEGPDDPGPCTPGKNGDKPGQKGPQIVSG
jgi:class 3 adenylate cyclase